MFPTPEPPGSDASAYDWLFYLDPSYVNKLTPAAQERLKDVPFYDEATLAGQGWGALQGRDMENTAYYNPPKSVFEGEHIFVGEGRLNNPKTWQHETLHALERLAGVHVGNLWEDIGPGFQHQVSGWYGGDFGGDVLAPEAFVWMAQHYGFEPWRIPTKWQPHFENIYLPEAFERPPLPDVDPKYVGMTPPPPGPQMGEYDPELGYRPLPPVATPPPPTTRPKKPRPGRTKRSRSTKIRPI